MYKMRVANPLQMIETWFLLCALWGRMHPLAKLKSNDLLICFKLRKSSTDNIIKLGSQCQETMEYQLALVVSSEQNSHSEFKCVCFYFLFLFLMPSNYNKSPNADKVISKILFSYSNYIYLYI